MSALFHAFVYYILLVPKGVIFISFFSTFQCFFMYMQESMNICLFSSIPYAKVGPVLHLSFPHGVKCPRNILCQYKEHSLIA